MSLPKLNKEFKELLGEFYGTFIIVFGGCGSIAVAVLLVDLTFYGVAACWGLTVALAIFASRCDSKAHLNPAVSFGFFLRNEINVSQLLSYWLVQVLGGMLGGLVVYLLFQGHMDALETANGTIRGESIQTAQILAEFYPNPGFTHLEVPKWLALALEAVGTFVLMLVILVLGRVEMHKNWPPILIGLTISLLIIFIAPYTQAGFNPARDFGPRTTAYLLGWNPIAYSNAFWLYAIGPLVGSGLVSVIFPKHKKSEAV